MINFSFFGSTHYTFEGMKEGEEVIIFLHRHWWTLANRLIALFLGAFLPFVALVVFGSILLTYNLLPLFAFLWAGYYLLLWYVLFYTLTMYSLDTWIVTNLRIIDSRQHGFFNRVVAELSLGNIQDVSFNIEGAVPTMMNYGDVHVQTAGSEKYFHFVSIANPQEVKDHIMQITDEFRKKNPEHTII